ncbi:alpha/beta hydrolase [Mycolicibacterium pyrenivorans]|uniref:alpha/beta hydrolase n=1 Tax=Mycolicibacterium pyrenivorans TaxID=187102 RepID=UPI0021F27662|nr:alpha/beta hydrolase [Mycolicibacterium pyrenivorans]MCV7152470.1 alpha/beta hydrolase fold domain-containing protein [Mycolicibacterium pyrenivorans]
MLAGAGVAAADDGSSTTSGAQASSGAGDSDSGRDTQTRTTPGSDADDDTSKTDSSESEESEQSEESEESDPEPATRTSGRSRDRTRDDDGGSEGTPPTADDVVDSPESALDEPDASGAVEESESTTPEVSPAGRHHAPEETQLESTTAEVSPAGRHRAPEEALPEPTTVETDLGSSEGAVVMRLAAAEVPPLDPDAPNLLDILNGIGTRFYNFYTNAMHSLAGPVRVPLGSKVRVASTTLTIGDGGTIAADWYIPKGNEQPTGLIYLQHGFLASARFYSATAAYLADKTNSIVVAPTLTWNFFDLENYPLEWPQTGRAIADLFTGDRAALNASAQAAGYAGILPTRVVLAGHSAGGGLVAMVGRYMAELGNTDDLAGVVMLDGVQTLSLMSDDVGKIPLSIPVYNLAGEASSWNWYGDASRRLARLRPGMFTGVTMRGGQHSDAMQSTSGALQMVAYFATGFSSPLDVLANRVLATGWITDMFAGTRTAGLYDGKGSTRHILSSWWWRQLTTRTEAPAARRTYTSSV